MKNLMLIFSMLFLLSCGTDTPKSNDVNGDTEKGKTEKAEKSESTDDADNTTKTECDIFLDDFENWIVDIEATHKKVKENPKDNESTQKILQANQKFVDWVNKWESLSDCADDEKYEDRMLDLEDRLNKAVSI